MYTLLLRLAAPLQSWGVDSKYDIRRTQREPTKSGVIGLIASAMGKSREESLEDLASLRFGVRVDQPGRLHRDFHMVKKDKKTSYLTYRYYIEDAVFLAGLESDDKAFLNMICDHLKAPSYPLFLGRRSCPPTHPFVLGVREGELERILESEPWQVNPWRKARLDNELQLYVESDGKSGAERVQQDAPVSFDSRDRRYGFRFVRDAGTVFAQEEEYITNHDPLQALRGI